MAQKATFQDNHIQEWSRFLGSVNEGNPHLFFAGNAKKK